MGALCCVVVLCVLYALILPALTLEKTLICEKQEHTHSEGCYTQVTTVSRQELICTVEHEHTEECYKTVEEPVDTQVLTCGLEESESHLHSALCYGTWELTCGLEEHTHGEECYNPPSPAEAAASVTPLQLDNYISDAVLFYRVSSSEDWKQVDTSNPLPGNAELKLDISYENIHVNDLNAAGRQVTYTLPQILRAPTGTGQINDSNNQRMGTMTVENSVVTLTFDETWLNTHHSTTGNDAIKGSFHVQSQIDLGMADENPSLQITVGSVEINLNFEPDIIAQYADVTILKGDPVAIQEDGADYLQYTLTVTAGQDGAPNVVVKDNLTDKSQIVGYVGISEATPTVSDVTGPVETVSPAGQPGTYSMDGETMVWTIGSMESNETRTLTYRVKLKEGYLGGTAENKPSVANTAALFCGTYKRGEDSSLYTPKAEATMTKVAGGFNPTPDGGGTITYTVWIHAGEANTYTLTNVRIWDALDGSIDNRSATAKEYLPYLSYVEDSFRWYNGGQEKQNGSGGLTPEGGNPVTLVYQKKQDGTTNPNFISCDVGTLAPGESKTLTYTVKLAPGIFPTAGNEAPTVYNRAQIHAGDSSKGNEANLNSYSGGKTVDRKVWSNKHAGIKQETDGTVSITGRVYGADGKQMENPPTEFTAPADSYQYQVDINSAGDWDVSNAAMKDDLLGDFAKYIGYARVQAFNVDASGNRTLADTVWLAVDGKSEFQFTPSSVGWTGKQAYELTYYTHVEVPVNAPVISVENKFDMTGKVGLGNGVLYDLGAYASVTNTVEGTSSFAVSKHSWYYEPSKVTTGEYANGAIYWYIQVDVDGTEIPANTYLKDVTSYNSQFMYDSSLVGLYTGSLGDKTVADYDDVEDLLASGKLTRLTSGYSYKITPHTEGGKKLPFMTVHLTEGVPLGDGESLFMIVKIEPHENPAGLTGTEHYSYHNGVESSYDGNNWVPWGDPKNMVIYGSNGIGKTMEKVSSWNGTEETVVMPASGTASPAALAGQEKGTYVFWKVQLNLTGYLHGGYWVEEIIPDGMKLAYVECTGVGKGYTTAKPSCVQKSPGEGWTEYQRAGALPTYYYTNGQTARWYVDGLQPGGNNTYTVDFLVVCRVTDADVLMGGVEKTFQNEVKLLRESGKLIDSSGSPVTLQCHTLSKHETYSSESDKTRFPFVITLNPLGEDLVPEADTLSLVDTLSSTLRLDLSSIQVVETGTNTVVTGWGSSVDGQTLTLTLPDQKPLTVTYSAWINAKPGDRIDISNDAHWQGYPTPSGGAVDKQNFEFNISGSGSTTEIPSVRITKLDENNISKTLDGAQFSLTKAELVNDTIQETTETWTGTTGANGQLTFGKEDGQTMAYNAVYCLRETQAPAGYVLDGTPHYFVIAKKLADETYPTFPPNVQVHYTSSEYSYQALNHKGQITVQKTFSDPGGNDYRPVPGTYTFGLYTAPDGSGDPLKTVTITYSDTDTAADKTAVFRDLPLDQTYYVFELDGSGNPVREGGNLSDRFVVRYNYPEGSGGAALTSTNGDQTVTVTNWVLLPELPETGCIGTAVSHVAGSILLAGAALLLLTKRRTRFGT